MKRDEETDRLLRQAARNRAGGHSAACLDGERLAAYVDGGLRPDERAAAEAHIADCARCLQLTAAIVQTEPAAGAKPRRSWFRTGWLVPLTAAAVGLSAWMIVRDPRRLEIPTVPETLSTRVPDAAAPPLLPSETSKATVPQFRQEPEARREARGDAPPGRGALADTAAAGNRTAERKQEADAVAAPGAAAGAAAAPATPPAPPQPALSAQEAAALARDGLAVARTPAAVMQVVVSPDPAVRWRFSGITIEKTTDGGATWVPQNPGATGFAAGSAPSADILWVAGKAGLVLLTTDGRTWQRVDLPDPGPDIVAITAVDGRTATVTTSAGSTYRTTDGGRTWTLQETAAAPF